VTVNALDETELRYDTNTAPPLTAAQPLSVLVLPNEKALPVTIPAYVKASTPPLPVEMLFKNDDPETIIPDEETLPPYSISTVPPCDAALLWTEQLESDRPEELTGPE